MKGQAAQTSWLIHDRDEAHHAHLHMEIRKFSSAGPGSNTDAMDGFEKSLEAAIYETAKPKPHTYLLSPVVPKP